MQITITAEGFATVEEFFKATGMRSTNLEQPLNKIADVVMGDFSDQFDTEGRGKWPANRPETTREKMLKGLDPRVMRASNALRNSLVERGDTNQMLEINEFTLDISSRLPYAERQLRKHP